MLRRFTSLAVASLGLLSMAQLPPAAALKPAPAVVPTAKKVITTAPPAPSASTAPHADTPAPAAPAAPNGVERARQGVVVLERQGKPLALGAVLEGDGRILSALSPLTNGNFLSARYSDGALVPLELVHSDRGWDLALLAPVVTPTQPRRLAGLRAAATPSFVGLQSFVLKPPSSVALVPASLKLSPGLLGGDGTQLTSAYDLGSKPGLVGAPIVNAEGEAVALVARACPAPATPACVPAAYAAPVSALKKFLQRVPAEAASLGVEAAAEETPGLRGVRVVAVTSDSPAAFAGIRSGRDGAQADLIVAVNGVPVATPSELNEAVRAGAPADSVDLLLFGLGRYRHATVKLRPSPSSSAPTPVTPRPRAPTPHR
jgi:serine protease Do